MKHLKTYESINANFKKYMVYHHNNKYEYYIDEFVSIENDKIYFRIKFNYNIKTDKWNDAYNFKDPNSAVIYKYTQQLVFTDDNIKKCLEFVNLHADIDKYNL